MATNTHSEEENKKESLQQNQNGIQNLESAAKKYEKVYNKIYTISDVEDPSPIDHIQPPPLKK